MEQEASSILNDILSDMHTQLDAALSRLFTFCGENTSQIANACLILVGIILLWMLLRWLLCKIPKKIKEKNTKTETTFPEIEKLKKTETKSSVTSKGYALLTLYYGVVVIVAAVILIFFILPAAS